MSVREVSERNKSKSPVKREEPDVPRRSRGLGQSFACFSKDNDHSTPDETANIFVMPHSSFRMRTCLMAENIVSPGATTRNPCRT
jgi:hypothetical protein